MDADKIFLHLFFNVVQSAVKSVGFYIGDKMNISAVAVKIQNIAAGQAVNAFRVFQHKKSIRL